MKKPSSIERADASAWLPFKTVTLPFGDPPCPEGAGWRGRQPNS